MHLHPLSLSSFRNLMGLLIKYGCDFDRLPAAFITALFSLASTPARLVGRRNFRRVSSSAKIFDEPIIIVGHWRSGTTHLHNILCQDARFGYVSLLHALAPEIQVEQQPLIGKILQQSLPKTRPQDNVRVENDAPQEEDFPIAGISPQSFFHGFYFPRELRSIFQSTVLFEDENGQLDHQAASRWSSDYLRVLKRASWEFQQQQLILKNPANSARIKTLLRLFPKAKFIHIYRNPYDVFFSNLNLYRKWMSRYGFRVSDSSQLEADIFYIYKRLMTRFFEDFPEIPVQNRVEVRFEELIENPAAQIDMIYSELNLPSLSSAQDSISSYLESQRQYTQNVYEADSDTLDKIYAEWSFTIDRWQY